MPLRFNSHHLVLATLAVFATGCAATKTATNKLGITTRLDAPGALRGNLVVYWMLPDELQRDEHSPAGYRLRNFRAIHGLLARAVTFPRIELGGGRTQRAQVEAPTTAILFAVFDTHGRTLDALLDDTLEGDAVAEATPAATTTTLVLRRRGPQPAPSERCRGERNRLEIIDAPEVAGTIGNPTQRRLCVHLPPGYDDDPTRRYPVVYVLPGLSGSDASGSVMRVFGAADEVVASDRATIFVGVNIQTKSGASYLANSP